MTNLACWKNISQIQYILCADRQIGNCFPPLYDQMEELLKEVVLSEKKKHQVDSFVLKITELLQSVPETPVVEVSVLLWHDIKASVEPL